MTKEAILQIVAMVPTGRVATYGQVAQLAGLGRAARYVGTTLKHLPAGSRLPWHRIVNSQGKISFPEGSESYERQKKLLADEGIVCTNGRISLKTHGWGP